MRLGAYIHPWDLRALRARGGLAALKELGFGDLSLASAYHAGKWLTPWSPEGMVRELEDGTTHFPVQRAASDWGELAPVASSEATASDVEWLRVGADAADQGMTVRAWTIFYHNSRLGRQRRSSAVQNAFGDTFTWGLCPARPEVQDYGERLAQEVGALSGLGVLEIEALGWMGNKHGSHHAKSAFPDEPFSDFLLSYCLCSACSAGLRQRDVDPDRLRDDVRGLLGQVYREGDAMAPSKVARADAVQRLSASVGADRLEAMLDHRRTTLRRNLERVRAAVPEGVRLASHLEWDPLFTGSQLGIEPVHVADLLDEVVLTCYGKGPEVITSLWQDRPDLASLAASVAVFPKAPQFESDDDLRALIEGLPGVGGLRVYHVGLLPWRTVERVARALSR